MARRLPITIAKLPKSEHPIMISTVMIHVPVVSILDVIFCITNLLPRLERTIARMVRMTYIVSATPASGPITPFIMTSNAKNHTIPKRMRRTAVIIVGATIFFMLILFAFFRIPMRFIEQIRISQECAEAGLCAESDRPPAILYNREVLGISFLKDPSTKNYKFFHTLYFGLSLFFIHVQLPLLTLQRRLL